MTPSIQPFGTISPQERIGRRIAIRLTAGADDLPYDISERLRAARVQAVARRKMHVEWQAAPATAIASGGSAAVLGGPGGAGGWLKRLLASTVPLVALLAGLVAINLIQDEDRMQEIVDVDAALLADDLPPSAYADAGFLQFLKAGGNQPH